MNKPTHDRLVSMKYSGTAFQKAIAEFYSHYGVPEEAKEKILEIYAQEFKTNSVETRTQDEMQEVIDGFYWFSSDGDNWTEIVQTETVSGDIYVNRFGRSADDSQSIETFESNTKDTNRFYGPLTR